MRHKNISSVEPLKYIINSQSGAGMPGTGHYKLRGLVPLQADKTVLNVSDLQI